MVRERAARIESKGEGHKSQNGTTKDIVTSGKWTKQVSKNKDWKWSFRLSNFFFLSREHICFVFRAEAEVESRFLRICLILFQVQIHILLLVVS